MREHADRRYRLDQDGPLVEEFVCGADALVRAGPPGRCELIDFLKTGHKFRGCVMYPVAPRIACTACKREVFFAIRLQHARLQLIHIFQGDRPT